MKSKNGELDILNDKINILTGGNKLVEIVYSNMVTQRYARFCFGAMSTNKIHTNLNIKKLIAESKLLL